MKNKFLVTLLIILGVLLGVVGGVLLSFWFAKSFGSVQQTNMENAVVENRNNQNTTTKVNQNTNSRVTVNTNVNTEVNTNSSIEQIEDEGITWLAEPQELEDLELFKNTEGFSVTYFAVADTAAGGKIIFAKQTYDGPTQPAVMRFRQEADGSYVVLTEHSNADDFFLNELNDDIQRDPTVYASLDYPETLRVGDLDLRQSWAAFSYPALFEQIGEVTQGDISLFGTTAYGPVYLSDASVQTELAEGSIHGKLFLLKLADSSTVMYRVDKNFLADDGSLMGTFVGSSSADFAGRSFTSGLIADGCGYPKGDQYAPDLTASQLKTIGTTPTGETLYSLNDPESDLFGIAYETYSIGRDPEGENPPIPFEDFVAAEPIIIWQDSTGDYLIFTDSSFAALVECGKPVVYLYPTEPTTVSVQVGATVSVSDPVYTEGWTVTAQPTGKLTTPDGKNYPYLFWEGKGYGTYPNITHGRVVLRSNIEQELKSDLAQLGLNQTETQDFLDFWLPKMPNTPYIRLTWLTTPAMNQLAPLTISPKPDTLIRVFLDFAGQDTANATLLPQVLRSTERNGFTVVEWGGLLVGGK